MTTQSKAKLRVCASCEWLYKSLDECPKCGWVSYGARYVYGDICYRWTKTQYPWKRKKLTDYEYLLDKQIEESKAVKKDIGVLSCH